MTTRNMTRKRGNIKEEYAAVSTRRDNGSDYDSGNDDTEMRDRGYTDQHAHDLQMDETPSSETMSQVENIIQQGQRYPSPVADDGIKEIGKDVALVSEVMSELRALGVSHTYGVPELCAMGEQSAGKSSLIGALAGIHLPSGSGTCTRVPVQIKTRDDPNPEGAWTCNVLLSLDYAHYRQGGLISGKEKKIGPWWEKSTPDTVEFVEITNKSDLEMAMKAAQLALLNPQNDPLEYVPGKGKLWNSTRKPLESFSPNRLVLDISEPGHQTLSFIDLPGIIQNAQSAEMVDVVSKLVKYFIKRQSTLLLCVLPMSTDPQNSTAIRYVREAKADDRCIGVLSKPDLLKESDKGDIKDVWIPLLRGLKEGFKMVHGYYVTKQPHNSEFITHEQARIDEEHFFNNIPPWTTHLEEFNDRFGTKKLREVLAKILANRIKLELPNIRLKILDRTSQIDRDLKRLPKPAEGEIQPKVLRTLGLFSARIENEMDSRSEHFRNWRELRCQFRDAIALIKPVIMLKDQDDETSIPPSPPKPAKPDLREKLNGNGKRQRPFELIDSSDDESVDSAFQTPTRGVGHSKAKPVKSPGTPLALRGDNKNWDKTDLTKRPGKRYFPRYNDRALRFRLRDITSAIREYGGNLPGYVDPQTMVHLCKRSVETWKGPKDILLSVVENELQTLFKEVLSDVLADYVGTDLCIESEEKIRAFLSTAMGELAEAVDRLYQTEHQDPFTVNEDDLDNYRRTTLTSMKEKRKKVRAKAFQDRLETEQSRYTYGAQRLSFENKITDAQLGVDPFEKELDCAAYVHGYYRLAASRFVDNVCQLIQTSLFSYIRLNIQYWLENQLNLTGEDGNAQCRNLVETIDPMVRAERERLQNEKESLIKAHEKLQELFNQLDPQGRAAVPNFVPVGTPAPSIFAFSASSTPKSDRH